MSQDRGPRVLTAILFVYCCLKKNTSELLYKRRSCGEKVDYEADTSRARCNVSVRMAAERSK